MNWGPVMNGDSLIVGRFNGALMLFCESVVYGVLS